MPSNNLHLSSIPDFNNNNEASANHKHSEMHSKNSQNNRVVHHKIVSFLNSSDSLGITLFQLL